MILKTLNFKKQILCQIVPVKNSTVSATQQDVRISVLIIHI